MNPPPARESEYLAANKLYRASIPSGEIKYDTVANFMTLYRDKNKTTRDGKTRLAQALKSMDAAMLLEKHPKFSQSVGRGYSESSPRYRVRESDPSSGESDGRANKSSFVFVIRPCTPQRTGNVSIDAPFLCARMV